MKVLVIPSFYPDNSNPTHGIFFKNQVEGMANYVDVSVINIKTDWLSPFPFNLNKNRSDNFPKYLNENGINLYQDKCFAIPKFQPLSSKSYKRKALAVFSRLIEEQGMPDLIHAHITYPGGYIGSELSKIYKIPLIVTEHASYFSSKLLTGSYKKYSNQVISLADKYTAVSSTLANMVKFNGREDCIVIPNFINVKDFQVKKERSKDIFRFINIAAMRHIKGIDILLKAIKILVFDMGKQNFIVYFVGGGKDEKKYRKMAKTLGIEEWCRFYSNVNYASIPSLIFGADSLVIASRFETFGIAGIEAMACGLPVVSTDCGGTREFVNGDTGIIIEGHSAEALASGMLTVMEKKEFWNPDTIRENVDRNYSIEAVVQQIIEIYNDLLS